MSMYECPKCGGLPGVTACCSDQAKGLVIGAQPAQAVPSDVVRDAERYRKFRSAPQDARNKFEHYAFDALDAAIDAAIAAQGAKT